MHKDNHSHGEKHAHGNKHSHGDDHGQPHNHGHCHSHGDHSHDHGQIGGQSGMCEHRMQQLIFDRWLDKIKESEIFSPEEDINKWIVKQDNLKEFLESVHLNEFVNSDEVEAELIQVQLTNFDFQNGGGIPYSALVKPLSDYCVNTKEISLKTIYGTQFSTPADRICSFFKTVKKDILDKQAHRKGQVTDIEEIYMEELEFGLRKINERNIYSHAEGTYGGRPMDFNIGGGLNDSMSNMPSDYQRSEGSSAGDVGQSGKFLDIRTRRR